MEIIRLRKSSCEKNATALLPIAVFLVIYLGLGLLFEYGITPRRAACLLDTFSCIFQGVIPYGAQMLVVLSAAAGMGCTISAFQIMGYLFYPYLLPVTSMIAIFTIKEKT